MAQILNKLNNSIIKNISTAIQRTSRKQKIMENLDKIGRNKINENAKWDSTSTESTLSLHKFTIIVRIRQFIQSFCAASVDALLQVNSVKVRSQSHYWLSQSIVRLHANWVNMEWPKCWSLQWIKNNVEITRSLIFGLWRPGQGLKSHPLYTLKGHLHKIFTCSVSSEDCLLVWFFTQFRSKACIIFYSLTLI